MAAAPVLPRHPYGVLLVAYANRLTLGAGPHGRGWRRRLIDSALTSPSLSGQAPRNLTVPSRAIYYSIIQSPLLLRGEDYADARRLKSRNTTVLIENGREALQHLKIEKSTNEMYITL